MDRRKLLLMTAAAIPVAGVLGLGRPALAAPLAPLSVGVEPLEAGEVAYALLAPTAFGGVEQAKVVLRLALTNTGTTDLTIDNIAFSFPGAWHLMQGVDIVLNVKANADDTVGDGGVIKPGKMKNWSNGNVGLADGTVAKNQVYLPLAAATKVNVFVYVTGYADPVIVTLPLAPYQVAHRLPIHARDLRPGEMVSAQGDHWANGGRRGDQIFAHDIDVVAWDGGKWTNLLPGKDNTKVENYRCWGLPIRAVADGTVFSALDGMVDNLAPGGFPEVVPDPTAGNSLWLQHDDGTMTFYTHLQQGSVTKKTSVLAGEVVGLLGTSGYTTNPHIHLEVRKNVDMDFPLRPLQINDAWMIDQSFNSPFNPESALWVPANGRAVPNNRMLIWPEASRPAWYPPNKDEIVLYGIPAADYQVTNDRLVRSGYRPVWIDVHEFDNAVFFNVIFRPKNGVSWSAGHGMTGAEYQAAYTNAEKEGFRLINVASYLQSGAVRYAAIFCKQAGPTMAAYHGVDQATHVAQFDALTKGGFHPVNISVVSLNGDPRITAFYHKEEVGVFVANSFTTVADYQLAWAANSKAGRHLSYLSACQHGGGARISAIFQEIAPGKGGTVGRHNLGAEALRVELETRQKADLLTRVIAGYVEGKGLRYGAAWRA